jgi:hypothetical protein
MNRPVTLGSYYKNYNYKRLPVHAVPHAKISVYTSDGKAKIMRKCIRKCKLRIQM